MREEGGRAFVHVWQQGERTITFTWIGPSDVLADRVYGFAFTPEGTMLLVSDAGGEYWLPGGGVEAGETAAAALARELREEAAASLTACEKLGTQLAENEKGEQSYQAFYWCRITLAEKFLPQFEISERKLVEPHTFLDELFWGRHDPKAEMLLERALGIEKARLNQALTLTTTENSA